ncbi:MULTISPECIES: ABC transporter permease [Sporosarcina]|uniref:ABC transporter permease n=1 Tax=Sporosarcina TaxID=1569 RepID=UPI00058D1761|nr:MULTISPECIES: ABC transporter permease [Sporosarcina]WJY26833.1 ABC transporter permease [Sporosarcina sp. 0.2-SM1T-5]
MKKTIRKRHSLAVSTEYTQANFTWVLSLVLTGIFLWNSISFKTGDIHPFAFSLFGVWAATTCFQVYITRKMKKDLLQTGVIPPATRRLGYVQLVSLAAGNIFAGAFAFNLINAKKSVEYTFAAYTLLTQFTVLAISAVNLFKPYVSDTFLPSMGTLLLIGVFYLAVLILVVRHVQEYEAPRWMTWVALLLLASAVTGNLFALLLGWTLLMKTRSSDRSRMLKWNVMWEKITRNSTAMLGMFFILLMLAISITSRFTFDYALAVENNYSAILQPPSAAYPFGTDNFGRDVFSRIVFGARISLLVGFAATILPGVIGGFLGAIAGYYSNHVDNWIMRLLDILYSIPGILLAIAIIAAFGANTVNLIIALSVGAIPTYARTMRANVLMVSNYDFVDSAKALGESNFAILFKQVVPNSLAPMIVKSTLTIGGAVIATSSLSYLGLGVEPHIPEWGNILKVGSAYLETNSYLAIFPGLAIILLVLSFNFLGDGLRDALDPKLD